MKLEYIRVIRQMVIFKKYSEIMRVDVSFTEVSLSPRCCVDKLLLIKCNASKWILKTSASRELSRLSLIEGTMWDEKSSAVRSELSTFALEFLR